MYDKGSYVEMKKPHACTIKSTGKKANRWEITSWSGYKNSLHKL